MIPITISEIIGILGIPKIIKIQIIQMIPKKINRSYVILEIQTILEIPN